MRGKKRKEEKEKKKASVAHDSVVHPASRGIGGRTLRERKPKASASVCTISSNVHNREIPVLRSLKVPLA